jgi:hypothetical protein
MRHSDAGAVMPRLVNIEMRATKVSGGNPRDRQLETTVGVTPKAWATAVVPPKISMTSFADLTLRGTITKYPRPVGLMQLKYFCGYSNLWFWFHIT